MTINDKAGQPFDGATTYRLNVPANPPVTLYWSATIYDRATHALIRNMQWSSRASTTPGIQKNADGSVDVYFGPKAPGRQGFQLGSHRPQRKVRSSLPLLRTAEAAVRQDVEAA